MKKFLIKIKFTLRILLRYTLGIIFCLNFTRDKKLYIFANYNLTSFVFNTKFLYLFLNQTPHLGITPVWITEDKKIIKALRDLGYKVYKKNSLKAIYYTLRSKYWFVDNYTTDISRAFSYGAQIINLWHGIPLKKIEFDIKKEHCKSNCNRFEKFLLNAFYLKSNYYSACGDYDAKIFTSAFLVDRKQIKILGSPKLDALFESKKFKHSNLFMEKDFDNILNIKSAGKKLLLYVPTFRDTGRDISGWLNSNKIKEKLKQSNAILIFKLHPCDKSIINIESQELYQLSNTTDLYAILKYMDCLITDYSSIYFDYLLLDRQIIFYPFDLKEYITQDRSLYVDYDEYTPGIKAYNEDELTNAIQCTINGEDNYKQARAKIRNEVFLHQDGNACERIVEFVKNLDK